ncbi:hypothetical protein VPH35_082307 [Triticum aestivum]
MADEQKLQPPSRPEVLRRRAPSRLPFPLCSPLQVTGHPCCNPISSQSRPCQIFKSPLISTFHIQDRSDDLRWLMHHMRRCSTHDVFKKGGPGWYLRPSS